MMKTKQHSRQFSEKPVEKCKLDYTISQAMNIYKQFPIIF